jgi:uncharacterized protein YndB with AHSA1/START domain
MTVVDTTAPSQTEAVTLEFELRHPPTKVWRALTQPELISEWLLPTVGFQLEPGATFLLQAPPMPSWDGVVNCRVVAIEAPKKLSYHWVVGDIDTVVTFTLTETSTGTHLSLVQSGFKPEQKHNFAGARYGLKMMGGRLVELLGRIS